MVVVDLLSRRGEHSLHWLINPANVSLTLTPWMFEPETPRAISSILGTSHSDC